MRVSLFAAVTVLLCAPMFAEMARPMPPRGFLPPRPAITSAGVIFSGTVLKVEHLTPAGSPGITHITFHVENAIRGVRQGQNLIISEWAGLWNSGERYRTGERVLLFLYPQSKLGLTSPVGGTLGRYEVDHNGRVLVDSSGSTPKPIRLQNFTSAIRQAVHEQ